MVQDERMGVGTLRKKKKRGRERREGKNSPRCLGKVDYIIRGMILNKLQLHNTSITIN